jgi:transcriptional regulator with XRE-family HTH domain
MMRVFSADALRTARIRAGLSRQYAAANCGVTDRAFRSWEDGTRQPRPDMIARAAELLGVTESELFAAPESRPDQVIARLRRLPAARRREIAEALLSEVR